MKAIVVDDELYMLETLEEAVRASSDITQVERFRGAVLCGGESLRYCLPGYQYAGNRRSGPC